MSVKKFLKLSAAGLITVAMTSAFAGGPELPPAPFVSESNIYLEVNLGYARVNWEDIVHPIRALEGDVVVFTNRGKGGFAGGVDVGYAWNRYISAELGWYYLPRAKLVDDGVQDRTKSWFLYTAAKLTAPLFDHFDLFFKGGLAFRYMKFDSELSSAHVVRPLFALGMEYDFDPNWLFAVQYMHVGEGTRVHFRHGTTQFAPTPAVHMITGTIGYKFVV